jgi:aspartate kinase
MTGDERRSRFDQGDDIIVMKFGGTSLEDAAAIRRVNGIVKSRGEQLPVVVVSALAKVTDQLLEAGQAAAGGRLGWALANVREIYVRHERLADELIEAERREHLHIELRGEFQALEALLHATAASRLWDLRLQDHLLGFGERLSSRLITAALAASGVPALHIDASQCILTDARHGQATPDWEASNLRLQDALLPLLHARQLPVLEGFIASTSEGVPTTLGRGGSDFTAAIVGAALGAVRVEIWTDVDGVMTTDPKLCSDACLIRRMSFEEAAELAGFGAKVLHPATLAPAMRENIPVFVLNSRNPDGAGTEIAARARSENAVTAITAKPKVATVELQALRGIDSELLSFVYAIFDQYACAVEVMGTSPGGLSLVVSSSGALPEIAARLGEVANVRWENHKSLVCVIGDNLRRQPEIASRAFAAVSDLQVRVACQGASECTISFLVDESKMEESVRRLHAAFFPQQPAARDWGGGSAAFCQAG